MMKVEYNHRWFQKNADKIESWFDPDTFYWEDGSWALAQYCFNDFNIWWDKNKFNWEHDLYLTAYCWDWKDIWDNNKRGRDELFEYLRGDRGCLPIMKVD